MISIHEPGVGGGGGQGRGYGLDHFLQRFDGICKDHKAAGRANSFAFVFFDFLDHSFQRVLTDHGVFTKLDRLSGTELSVFYLHAPRRKAIETFNSTFLSKLGVEADAVLPCVVFFDVEQDQLVHISVASIPSSDLIHGLDELKTVIADHLTAQAASRSIQLRYLKWTKGAAKFVSVEAVKEAIKAFLFS